MLIAPQQELNLISTNVPDNPEPTYDNTATYNKGDVVQLNDKLYKCMQDKTTEISPEIDRIIWDYLGAINKKAMFDGYMNTATKYTDNIVVELGVSDVDALALFGLIATSVTVQIWAITNNVEIYNKTFDLVSYNITDWWEWTYNPPEYKRGIFVNTPMVFDGKMTIAIAPNNDETKCSYLSYGRTKDLGATLWEATVSRRSNVRKDRSPSGHVFLQKGISWKRMNLPVAIDTSMVDIVENRLGDIDGIPTLFIGDEREGGFESLLIFGFFRDFDIPISVKKSKYNIEVEGVG